MADPWMTPKFGPGSKVHQWEIARAIDRPQC